MRFTGSIALAVLTAASVSASPVSHAQSYTVKETHPVPAKWTQVTRAPSDLVLKFDIALKQSNFDELERHLYEVSDPEHPRYGQHLTQTEVHQLVQPSTGASKDVHDWLASHDISADKLGYSHAKDWISVELPVTTAERMLQTEYHIYMHEDGTVVVRTPSWSLPQHLVDHIDMISPTNSFFRPATRRKPVKVVETFTKEHAHIQSVGLLPGRDAVVQNCNATLVTSLCLRTLYGTLNYKPQVPGVSKVALVNYLGESNNRSDTRRFLQISRPEAVRAADTFKTVIIKNGTDHQGQEGPEALDAGADLEGNLDSETILGITYPVPLTAYNVGGSPPWKNDTNTPTNTNEPYLDWLQYVLAQKDLPQVISTSYDDDEQTVPLSYAKRVCNTFAQLGARGVSMFFASGDSGVGGDDTCISNDGTRRKTFLPEFPSSCPYGTSVGATKNFAPEVVAYDERNGFSSGGGFSNYFNRPEYQKNAVSPYVKALKSKYKGLYNKHGRAYPDIAAQGQSYLTVWNGTVVRLDGTSAATPAAAAIFALVNDALLAAGKKPLGFLNPWLYKSGHKAFNDVTNGTSLGCNTDGFPAGKGWDAVTGWGTPNFPAIRKVLGV
ncbi:peptidase S8/S53 domain-containing protein [Fimicolochytrium jonesii]|uniref:peptidase S8/S53 domain-containing protein n=1 Tax=Fimicolochytrium jonesii TaxID=1396493 RepID=UPI0022FF2D9F|nr:peptidase S8/S53 domain-containing protein [Fimicolochytrium jonesii]KAI8816570.1 peptidase S8/S53 domain-containing protein [Fimicolochytrium jonesii]